MTKRDFLNMTALTEGGVFFIAFLLGYIFTINPAFHLIWDWQDFFLGVVGIIPLLVLLGVVMKVSWPTFSRIRQFLLKEIGAQIASCAWYDLLAIAILAGVAEEILFRGFLQVKMEMTFGWTGGWILSNVLFGLLHFVSLGYAICAGIAGLYLGWLFDATDQRNLLIPIVTHGLYDYVAFVLLARQYRAMQERKNSSENALPENEPSEKT